MPEIDFVLLPDVTVTQPKVDFSKLPNQTSTKDPAPGIDLGRLPDQPKPLTPIFEFVDPVDHPILNTIQQAGAAGGTLLSSLAFGLPDAALNKIGYEIPHNPSGAGQALQGAAELGGFVTGPLKAAAGIARRLPFLARTFEPAQTLLGAAGKTFARNISSLGIGSSLVTPKTGVLDFQARGEQAMGGGQVGAGFSALSMVPTKAGRLIAMTAFTGIPSSLQHDPIEVQMFNYGLGAFFGKQAKSPRQVLSVEKPLSDQILFGLEGKGVKVALTENTTMLSGKRRMAKNVGIDPKPTEQMIQDIIASNRRPVHRINDETGMIELGIGEKANLGARQNLLNETFEVIKGLKQRPETILRQDDVGFLLEHITTKQKLTTMSDQQLANLHGMIENAPIESTAIFEGRPPMKTNSGGSGSPGQVINLWDISFRPGFNLLKKLGFGGPFEKGLTGQFFQADYEQSRFLQEHIQLVNNWKKVVGLGKENAKQLFQNQDGRLHSQRLSPKQRAVTGQIRNYLDTLIDHQNRHRAQFGEPPVERRTNYITHIFEDVKAELQAKKHPFPEYLEGVMRFTTPKRKDSPFLKERRGATGFVEDIWQALDAYAYRTAGVITDQPIRRANRLIRFIEKEKSINDKTGKRSLIDWDGIQSNLRNYTQDITGRPGPTDKIIRNTFDAVWNRFVPAELQIRSVTHMMSMVNGIIYGTQMGFRPKLALRNLGQHSLIIGQTGFKPLLWAIRNRKSPESQKLLAKSKVVGSREFAFAAETETIAGQLTKGLLQKGMVMFRGADMRNVEDAYLAGYRHAKQRGMSEELRQKRGDEVAATTQYLYTKGNRSNFARRFLGSRAIAQTSSIFTTWPANYVEFLIASSAPEHRANLTKYFATAVLFSGLSALAGIRGSAYTGLASPLSLLNILRGKLPVAGIAERPQIQAINDLSKLLESGNIKEFLFYTYRDTNE